MTRICMRLVQCAVFFAAVSGSAAAAHAQTIGDAAPVRTHTISTNPLLTTFGWYNVEYDRRLDDTKTWGVSTSHVSVDDVDYTNVSALVRYYPRESFKGFFIGGRGGVHRVGAAGESGAAFGIGPEIGYDWVLGARQKVTLSLGVGATRLFGLDLDDVSLTIPTLRLLNVGVAF
jgi:hypothetical protein